MISRRFVGNPSNWCVGLLLHLIQSLPPSNGMRRIQLPDPWKSTLEKGPHHIIHPDKISRARRPPAKLFCPMVPTIPVLKSVETVTSFHLWYACSSSVVWVDWSRLNIFSDPVTQFSSITVVFFLSSDFENSLRSCRWLQIQSAVSRHLQKMASPLGFKERRGARARRGDRYQREVLRRSKDKTLNSIIGQALDK